MKRSTISALLGLALLAAVCSIGHADQRVLALLGSSDVKSSHSQFFSSLEQAGFSVDIKSIKDKDLKLKEFDTFLYDSIILFAPKATSGLGGLHSYWE